MWYIHRPRTLAFMIDKISACGHIAAGLVKEDTTVMNFGQPFCASDKLENY
jgi:serine/threonine-protein kinase SRPK3